MVEIQIEDKKYDVPTEWKDITLEWWCGLYNILKKYSEKNTEEQTEEEKIDEVKTLRMNRDIFKYITKINDREFQKLEIESVNNAVEIISSMLVEYKPKGIESFEFENETFYFPKEFLKRNTFGDYIEATQLDMTIESMKHGKFDVLPEQMAILCRSAIEEYDDEAIPEKTDRFKKLTMDIVWEFSFFLTMRSLKLRRVFQTFLDSKSEEELKQAKDEFLQKVYTTNTSDHMVG
jgi:hypothetical protein